jgi:hypothetical protein
VEYANLLVRMKLGQPNTSVLAVVAQLANMFRASIASVAACQPMPAGYPDVYISEELIEQDRVSIETEMAAVEHEFRAALAQIGCELGWRSVVALEPLSNVLAREARSADLIVTELSDQRSMFDDSRHVSVGDLVMNAGRPCLILPDKTTKLNLDHVLVGWKDVAETRRAVRDALPLLRMAKQVTVIELAASEDLKDARVRVDDVVSWLARHQVQAQAVVDELLDETVQLRTRLADSRAGVIVAGAYGHSRLREWVFGGVTRNLLLGGACCTLTSH